jgi:S-adenosylmethionine:tRNA ribosyltransferase-isomerase
MFNLSDYAYELPERLIAHVPDPGRDRSRLLWLDRGKDALSHKRFNDLSEILNPTDLLVVNNTRVVPARLHGCKETGGKAEILIIDYQGGLETFNREGMFRCECLIKSSKRPRNNSVITFEDGLSAKVCSFEKGVYILEFTAALNVPGLIDKIGCMPLPPYIRRNEKREDGAEFPDDREVYQTVYAADKGAVAAPTAGLHFTGDLMGRLRAKGVEIAEITLHVGYGTFVPVRVSDIRDHEIHTERFTIAEATAEKVNRAKKEKRRIVAVGTTSVRTLEYSFQKYGKLVPGKGDCNLFIYPGYRFLAVDAMVTNFHIPESTLLMLVSAFAGREKILAAYAGAIEEEYRFFSYGDAMLIT